MIYIPVAGIRSGSEMRFSRSQIVTGKTHAVSGLEHVKCGDDVTVMCGRRISVTATWGHEAWRRMHRQPHATHQTNICRQCVRATACTLDTVENVEVFFSAKTSKWHVKCHCCETVDTFDTSQDAERFARDPA